MTLLSTPPPITGLSAVVTGGSRGLGLLLARELGHRGCAVTIAARDRDELQEATTLLAPHAPGGVHPEVCDVRERHQVRELFARTADRTGGVDIVIGNAGIIQVGPVDDLGIDGFDAAMSAIFSGAVHTALEALPYLRRSPAGGRLALIGSVGGLFAVPHLLPYSCAKSAVAALAEGLYAEERAHGVSVTGVHPGLMRTGSHLHALFGGDTEQEYAWFSALNGTPLLSMDAERAAERIITGIQRRRPRLVLTPAARLGSALHGGAPVTVTRMSAVLARALPERTGNSVLAEGRTADAARSGRRNRFLRRWTARNERAADRFNQRSGRRGS
ncbi:SDR family oxidoreductase [Streptomyces sp. NPDC006733]|uniref:SDR family NAD(P)-dependent oxidoreductase n=1 Tax=Streptomyces sp. NPDC006733 TaxID=3155460 RepID=UPI0033D35B2D